MSFYDAAKKIIKPIMKALFRVAVTGGERVPMEGSLLVCANHTSLFDPVLLGAFLPRQFHFMGKKELFKIPVLSSFIRAVGAFPVDRKGSDVGAIKTTISYVKDGAAVSVFPQGTRCPGVDPACTEVKSGVGMIACRAGCDVLPVFIKTKKNRVRLFGKIELIVGEPIKNAEFGFDEPGRKDYDRAAKMIFSEICSLGGYEYETGESGTLPRTPPENF